MDQAAGVAAGKAADLDGDGQPFGLLPGQGQGEVGDLAACAAAAEHALGAAVQVDQAAGADAAELQVVGADQAHFLGSGEHALQRRMHQAVIGEHRHHPGHGHAVVGAQGGAVGPQNVAFHHQLDGVLGEIVVDAVVLFAHHVGMALQQQGRQVFTALGAGFCDVYVQRFVAVGVQVVLLGEIQQILADGAFVARAAGDAADVLKIPQGLLGFSVAE